MCGIAGLLGPGGIEPALVTAMTDRIRARGPDDSGLWAEDDRSVVLGQRRLSIIDLSAAGHQPMISASGRFVIDYNGEIYNFAELRRDLEQAAGPIAWRGHSDTEVLLEAIAHWGIEAALGKAAGMFAIALWDRRERVLHLARDRFGEKPLYYGDLGRMVGFASELKALRAVPGFDATLDPASVRHLLAVGHVAPDRSIFRSMRQLAPGHRVELRPGQSAASASELRWFDYPALVHAGQQSPFGGEDEALAALEQALSGAVARQLVADVPVGTFLSGGIDSSLITALAARQASGRIRTFSIGFDRPEYDESPYAEAVAAHLGTDHQALRVTADDAREVIPLLPAIYDEPFGDSSQIPTYLVSRFARQQVTVALSGDAGDELFGGYNRHAAFPALWRRVGPLPLPLRRAVLGLAATVPPGLWNRALGGRRPAFFGHKLRRTLAIAAHARSIGDLYASFLDEWHGLPSPVAGEAAWQPSHPWRSDGLADAQAIMLADAMDYLPGDILTKVDRAAMAVSLETRVPFLDPQVAEVAARIPVGMKIAGGRGKVVLRRLLHTMVPPALVERPKAGFALPVGEWLRGPLRDWAESLLSPEELERDGLLLAAPIRARWQRHLEGRENASQALWPVLMLSAWRREHAA